MKAAGEIEIIEHSILSVRTSEWSNNFSFRKGGGAGMRLFACFEVYYQRVNTTPCMVLANTLTKGIPPLPPDVSDFEGILVRFGIRVRYTGLSFIL